MVEDIGETTGNQYYGEFDIRYQSTNAASENQSSYMAFDFAARLNNEDHLNFSLREAVWEKRFNNSRIALGRTTLDWSQVDEEWSLGHINNRVNFDFYEPGQEGLVGLFLDHKFKNGIKLSIFASMLYIPELNPGTTVDKDNGTVECNNPWCSAPPAEVNTDDGKFPVFYSVDVPDTFDTIVKYSVGANIGREFQLVKNDNFDISLDISAYALKKPENSPSISAEARYSVSESTAFVDVTPQFFYQDIVGSDMNLNFKNQGIKLYGSAISITPNGTPEGGRESIDYQGIIQRKIREDYLSAGAKYNKNNLKLQVGYIARVSEFDKKDDLLVSYPRWNQAIHLVAEKKLTRKFNVSLDYKYDTLTEDRITIFKTDYRFGSSVVAGLGVNIIGTNPDEESFWSKFENNDAVYSSLKYTF